MTRRRRAESITTDDLTEMVVWRLTPTSARELADFLAPLIPWRDGFHRDLKRLHECADTLDPPPANPDPDTPT